VPQTGDLGVREAVPFGRPQQVQVELRCRLDHGCDLQQQHELVDKPGIDLGRLVHLLRGGAGAERLHDHVEAAVVRPRRRGQQVVERLGDLIREAERRLRILEAAQGLAQRLGEVPADGHRLADTLHVRGQRGVGRGELFECESRHLDHDVVQGRFEAGRSLLGNVVRDFVECVANGDFRGDLGNGKAGRLRGQGRRSRYPRVHLDHDHSSIGWVDRELDVAAAGIHPNRTDDADRDIAHPLVLAVGESHCRSHGDRIAGMHSHRVQILDGADDHDVVGLVAHDLELVLLPAQDRLLDQHLAGGAGRQAGAGHPAKISFVVGQARAHATHGEAGADY